MNTLVGADCWERMSLKGKTKTQVKVLADKKAEETVY